MNKGFRRSAVPILDPITQFYQHCNQWYNELLGAAGARAALSATSNAAALDKLNGTNVAKQEEFDRLSKQLMCEAQTMPWFPRVSDLIREIAAAISAVQELTRASAMEIYTYGSRYGISDPFGSARTQLHRSMAEIKLYTALLPAKPHQKPLTDRQLEVWNALEHNVRSAKEIAALIDSSSAAAVRQLIREIRKADRTIERLSGRGYWRPDALPSDMLIV